MPLGGGTTEAVRLYYSRQHKRLSGKSWATMVVTTMVGRTAAAGGTKSNRVAVRHGCMRNPGQGDRGCEA